MLVGLTRDRTEKGVDTSGRHACVGGMFPLTVPLNNIDDKVVGELRRLLPCDSLQLGLGDRDSGLAVARGREAAGFHRTPKARRRGAVLVNLKCGYM